jgi:hypothetical protein
MSPLLSSCIQLSPSQSLELACQYVSDGLTLPSSAQDSTIIIARYDTEALQLWVGVRKVRNETEEMTWMPFKWFVGLEMTGLRMREVFCVGGVLDEGVVVERWNEVFGEKRKRDFWKVVM